MLFFKQERNPQRLYGILIIKIILTRVTLPHARYQFRKYNYPPPPSFQNRKKVETTTKRSEIKRKILKDFIN